MDTEIAWTTDPEDIPQIHAPLLELLSAAADASREGGRRLPTAAGFGSSGSRVDTACWTTSAYAGVIKLPRETGPGQKP